MRNNTEREGEGEKRQEKRRERGGEFERQGRDNDGLILSLCIFLQLQNPSKQIVLLTNDIGLKNRCTKEGIKTRV